MCWNVALIRLSHYSRQCSILQFTRTVFSICSDEGQTDICIQIILTNTDISCQCHQNLFSKYFCLKEKVLSCRSLQCCVKSHWRFESRLKSRPEKYCSETSCTEILNLIWNFLPQWFSDINSHIFFQIQWRLILNVWICWL